MCVYAPLHVSEISFSLSLHMWDFFYKFNLLLKVLKNIFKNLLKGIFKIFPAIFYDFYKFLDIDGRQATFLCPNGTQVCSRLRLVARIQN